MIQLKLAKASDINWINDKYKEIDFVPSVLSKESVAIAEVSGEKAGLGRLVQIDEKHAELGGMYVFEKFRNQGIARSIVNFLLLEGKKYPVIYCLPFAHLKNFYESFGFVECSNNELVPKDIKCKYQWCNQNYGHKVLLLQINKNSLNR